MPIAFKCPKCGKQFTVKDEMAGKIGSCPCGAKFKIPAPAAARSAAGSALAAAAPAKTPNAAKPTGVPATPPPPPAPPRPAAPPPPAAKPAPAAAAKTPLPPPPPARPAASAAAAVPKPALEPEEDVEEAPEEVPEEAPEETEAGESGVSAEAPEEAGGEEPEETAPPEEEKAKEEEKEGEGEAEKAETSEEEEEGAEVVAPAPKSWAGRILIFAGAACIIAGLFLPWVRPDTLKITQAESSGVSTGQVATEQPKEPGTHGLIEEEKTQEGSEKKKEDAPDASPPEDENVGWRNADGETVVVTGEESAGADIPADSGAAASGPKGLDIPKMFAATMPVFYAVYGLAAVAALLALLALIPGVILKGAVQKIFGLILALACAGSLGAILFGLNKTAADAGGLAALFGQLQIGLILTVAGGVACFLGGLICTFGVFGISGEASARSRGRTTTRSTVRMLPRRPEPPPEAGAAPTKPASKVRPPLRPAGGRPSAPLRPPPSGRKLGAPPAAGPRPSVRPQIAPKPPLRPPPKGGAAPSARKK